MTTTNALPDDPKQISLVYADGLQESYYCFGDCDKCNIRFQCYSGKIDASVILEASLGPELHGHPPSSYLEREAFGDVRGRILNMGRTDSRGRFYRDKWWGEENEDVRKFITTNELLYFNDKGMLICKKRPRPVHHVKDF